MTVITPWISSIVDNPASSPNEANTLFVEKIFTPSEIINDAFDYKELLPAPWPGKLYLAKQVVLSIQNWTTPYANNIFLYVYYGNSVARPVSLQMIMTPTNTNQLCYLSCGTATWWQDLSIYENQPMTIRWSANGAAWWDWNMHVYLEYNTYNLS